ncbi:MAG: SPFH domain-containing protein [Lachnospiraceae bacterium]|nr:SPFH domain-containing protein [Lachnospiraceae bacterium]
MQLQQVEEREIRNARGGRALFLILLGFALCVAGYVGCGICFSKGMAAAGAILVVGSSIALTVFFILLGGLHILKPKEALVLTLFGRYYGTIKKPGFYFTNPFVSGMRPGVREAVNPEAGQAGNLGQILSVSSGKVSVPVNKKISTKVMTLNNDRQKVNDALGNPVIIGAVVIWNVENPTKAVMNVEDYREYLSIQCDSTIRNIARLYPYDIAEADADEKTLRGSSQEIAARMRGELQEKVEEAGLRVNEVRITHLAYAEEVAAAMLQRQQAAAIIAARQKIVEGAVSMVKMAIHQLSEEEVVVLDEERKAAMVSNMLVVLCGNKDPQPVVNSGSIY